MPNQKTVPVFGYCPMGCGQTLKLLSNGFIVCETPDCPRAGAATEILADPETEHIVELNLSDFTLRHPLQERLDDKLMNCRLHMYIANMSGSEYPPGRYRVQKTDNSEKPPWRFEVLSGNN